MIQSIIDQVFLYDEDATEVEDYIYRGMMAGLMILILYIIMQMTIKHFRTAQMEVILVLVP